VNAKHQIVCNARQRRALRCVRNEIHGIVVARLTRRRSPQPLIHRAKTPLAPPAGFSVWPAGLFTHLPRTPYRTPISAHCSIAQALAHTLDQHAAYLGGRGRESSLLANGRGPLAGGPPGSLAAFRRRAWRTDAKISVSRGTAGSTHGCQAKRSSTIYLAAVTC
jgi:hypothetical protein